MAWKWRDLTRLPVFDMLWDMDFTNYRLPDGRVVAVDATAAKGAAAIGFTLVGGRVVAAIRVDDGSPATWPASPSGSRVKG